MSGRYAPTSSARDFYVAQVLVRFSVGDVIVPWILWPLVLDVRLQALRRSTFNCVDVWTFRLLFICQRVNVISS